MTKQINIQLCAHDITVKINNPGGWDGNGMGRADEMSGEILLRSGMPNSVQCATFLHEVFHMIFGIHGMTQENNEVAVSTLAAGMLSLLRNNPEVGRALINCESLEDLATEPDDE